MSNPTVTIVGNLTDDPELRFTPSGVAVCAFTVAFNPRTYDKSKGEYVDGDPSYYRCQAWRQLGENLAESLRRGARVIVYGQLAEERWEKDGEKHARWQVTAEAVGPDLAFHTAAVRKTTRTHDAPADDPWATASPERPAPAATR